MFNSDDKFAHFCYSWRQFVNVSILSIYLFTCPNVCLFVCLFLHSFQVYLQFKHNFLGRNYKIETYLMLLLQTD